MDTQMKCAVILNESLPVGVLANAAAILGMTLGTRFGQLVGEDVKDADGGTPPGIVTVPVPALRADAKTLAAIWEKASADDAVFAVDFTDVAQGCRVYGEYVERMGAASPASLGFLGIGLAGRKACEPIDGQSAAAAVKKLNRERTKKLTIFVRSLYALFFGRRMCRIIDAPPRFGV